MSETGKKTMIEGVEDDINELPNSYFSKGAVRVFDKYTMERLVYFHL